MSAPKKKARPSNIPNRDFGERSFHIVGIGASAGGMDALKQFFSCLPPDTGMGFVIVTHLDPAHKGMMPELIQRYTKMPVVQAEDGLKVKPNKVYIIPPNKMLSILHGTLQLFEIIDPQPLRLPIDYFFRQLALDQLDRAVGIILSGMGTDGTLGVRAIKENLGMVMAQEPQSAEFGSMPSSAIETNSVDYTAPADKLPDELLAYARGCAARERDLPAEAKHATALQKIFILLREQTGQDFSSYKSNTVLRRIGRRISVHKLSGIEAYLRLLQDNKQEREILFKELLIGVTSFFRDPQAWQELEERLRRELQDRSKQKEYRVWVAGCSSGEEAYSLAIVIRECLEQTGGSALKVSIYATDIDKDAIDRARQGEYQKNIGADLTPERLRKYFIETEENYLVKPEIRGMIVFAPQNLIMDPPFTKLDLICCRNLLIYLNNDMQNKLVRIFHFALNPAGTLFLGSSESLGSQGSLFSTSGNKGKLFVRKPSPYGRAVLPELPSLTSFRRAVPGRHAAKSELGERDSITEIAERLLLDQYSPPAVLVNETGDILFVSGSTGKYLELPLGKANVNIYAMARAGLREEVSAAIRRARSRKAPVITPGLKVKIGGKHQIIDLIVKPLARPESVTGLLLIVFKETAVKPAKLEKSRGLRRGEKFMDLENELKELREKLQNTVQEMETAQEELKSANEELQSTNEELQSTNEELTTSKEEMQSTNEELMMVNAELEGKNNELMLASNDMKNLLDSTDIATLFLDNDLKIKRFTPQATRIINLIAGDVGRSVADLVPTLKYQRLEEDAREVLEKLEKKEAEVEAKDGKRFIMRIIPYRTSNNVIDGVVVTFADISRFRGGQNEQH